MTITQFCVGFVICLAILIVTFLFCAFCAWITSDGCGLDILEAIWFGWIFSSVGCGICLTILLVQNGII